MIISACTGGPESLPVQGVRLAKSYQSFRKRERESRLREKAQLKRERRRESQEAKKKQDDATTSVPLDDVVGHEAEVAE